MVDRELFERYQSALSTNADLCKEKVEALLKKLDGLTPLEQAEFLMANYPKLVKAHGKVAADVARQFYQESRDAWCEEANDGASDFQAQCAPEIAEAWAYEDIQGTVANGVARLPKIAVRRTMQRADQTIALNVRRDGASGRWAIVPHPGACGWCVMVASNGWAYSERSVNAQRHDGCKCSVVVDFDRDSPSLAGYDPRAMQQAYEDARSTVYDDAEDTWWNRMTPEERAKYGRKGRSAHDVYLTKRITEEMDRRNRQWLQDQVPRHRTKEPGAKPLKKERDVGTALLGHGFDVKFIKEINRSGVKTADAFLNGEIWEFKIPEGWNPNWTVKDQFFKARGKGTDRLLISNNINRVDADEIVKRVREIFTAGDYPHINEVIVYDGEADRLIRLRR